MKPTIPTFNVERSTLNVQRLSRRFILTLVLGLAALMGRASAQQMTIKPYDLNKDSVVLTNGMVATTNQASRCGSIVMYNSSASTVYLLVYDLSTNSTPAAGRAPTLPAVPVPANSTGGWDWNSAGRKFQNGVIAAASTTPVTFTNAGNVCWFTVSYDGKPN